MSDTNVLFVCETNLVRSPLAAAICSLVSGGDERYFSCASLANPNQRPADPRIVREAQSRGVPLVHHQTRTISAEIVSSSTVVIPMDQISFQTVESCLEKLNDAPNVKFFAEFSNDLSLGDVPEPLMGEISFVELPDLLWPVCLRIVKKVRVGFSKGW